MFFLRFGLRFPPKNLVGSKIIPTFAPDNNADNENTKADQRLMIPTFNDLSGFLFLLSARID